MKTLDEHFYDWVGHVFSAGCGTGEAHILPALLNFMALIPEEGSYKYTILENNVGPIIAWLFITLLCNHKILTYGTCGTFGWLDDCGKELKKYLKNKTIDELPLYYNDDYIYCNPVACNCGPNGYEVGRKCPNPFWVNAI